jgi:hypothetical protein
VSSIEKFQAANANMWDGSTMAPPRIDPICLPELTTELFSLHLVAPEVVSFCPPQKKTSTRNARTKCQQVVLHVKEVVTHKTRLD